MRKYKAAFVSADPANSSVNYVYSAEQQKEIAAITDLIPGIAGPEDIAAGKLAGTEVIFSTWGMIEFTPEQLKKMPELKAT